MYFINATLNFAFSLFKILRLCTLLKIMMPKQNVFFLNKIGWHLVYERYIFLVSILYIGEFLCKLDRHEEANNSRLTDVFQTHQKLYLEWD